MSKISKIIIALAVCGLMATSARATLVVTDNPLGLRVRAAQFTLGGWDWASDDLQAAYANGQLDAVEPAGGVLFGTAGALLDGNADSIGLILYNTWTTTFTFTESYTGPRDLSADPAFGHALRIGVTGNPAYNNYKLEVYYETTDAPGTLKTLFKVEDLAAGGSPSVIYVPSDAASAAVENINKFYIKSFTVAQVGQTQNFGAGLTEFNVSLIPEPATMALVGITGLLALASRRFRM